MDKIRLNADELQVESFDAAPAARDRGTVEAHLITSTPSCINTDCGPSRCASSPCAC
jgi:hypothetical protein